jgi:hypothetical protein
VLKSRLTVRMLIHTSASVSNLGSARYTTGSQGWRKRFSGGVD